MDSHLYWIAAAVLGCVLFALSRWQRSIDLRESFCARSQLREARSKGSHRAIAQFPQIRADLCLGCGSCIAACPEQQVLGLVGGVARVIHGARCVGHARCAEACPVGAITVGLGDISTRADLPILSDALETSVPGLFIAGELGGISLIRNAIAQGARAVESAAARLRSLPASPPDALDLLIVGAGPAGLSAALRAQELGLRYLAIDESETIGGTVQRYPRKKLALVQSVDIPMHGPLKSGEHPKEEIVALWNSIARKHALRLQMGTRLTGLSAAPGGFEACTSRGKFRSRCAILALGRRGSPRKLGVPGEDSSKVLYQMLDAASYTGQKILIVGGGDSAVEAAIALARQPGNAVTLSYRKPEFFRLKPLNETRLRDAVSEGRVRLLLPSEVARIEPDAVALTHAGRPLALPNDAVFIFAGSDPPFPLLKEMGIRFGGEAAPAPRAA